MSHPSAILPGSTIGVLGGGQLGRMFAMAARRMGYRVHSLAPESDTPTGQVSDLEVVAAYADLAAVGAFARAVDVVTFEFENVPADTAAAAAEFAPVRPGGDVLHVTQQRGREKAFLASHGFPVVPFATARSAGELAEALDQLGYPAIVKTAAFGYDGKGQRRVDTRAEVEECWRGLAAPEAVVERFVDLECEISVVAARGLDGEFAHYGAIENRHARHILDLSVAPARVPAGICNLAVEIARAIVDELGCVGVLCVEFFVDRSGRLFVNELAPRPHNSGHLTVDASVTSQFEQQLRAVCGLPLGSTELVRPAAMANLLGDLWSTGEPNWAAACARRSVKLHLYGKQDARPGRKMGHLTATCDSADQAERLVVEARAAL